MNDSLSELDSYADTSVVGMNCVITLSINVALSVIVHCILGRVGRGIYLDFRVYILNASDQVWLNFLAKLEPKVGKSRRLQYRRQGDGGE